jgi:hypothetical protein
MGGEGMAKINSLSKIFSGLSSSSGNSGQKEANNHHQQQLGNSSFFSADEQHSFLGTPEKGEFSVHLSMLKILLKLFLFDLKLSVYV